MPSFSATVELVGADLPPMAAVVSVAEDRLRLVADGREIGDWSLQEADVTAHGEAFHLEVEGEELILRVADAEGFAEALGLEGSTPSRLSQAMAAASGDAAGSGAGSLDRQALIGHAPWWKSWVADAWRSWLGRRPAWKAYRTERHRLDNEISSLESTVSANRQELSEAQRDLGWAQQVAPRSLPIKTTRAETGLSAVGGVDLLETRKREGQDVWTPVDSGTVYFTDRRLLFSGKKDVQFAYDKLVRREITGRGMWLAVSSRKRDHILAGPVEQLAVVLAASQAVAAGESPTALHEERIRDLEGEIERDESMLSGLRGERTELVAPPRPISPAWIPAALLILLIGAVGSGSPPSTPEASVTAAPITTSSPATTAEVPTTNTTTTLVTTTVSVTSSSTPSTLPEGVAAALVAPPSASSSGDPSDVPPSGAIEVTVVGITDGDTLDVRLADGSVEPVRLIGINSPEGGECFAEESTAALTALAPPGSEIAMTDDSSDRDQYDRLLRYLWVGGLSVNEELVRRGAAIARRYPPDTAMADRLDQAQADAQDAGPGLWAPNVCGRVSDAEVRIVGLVADPPGDDNEVLNDEWVRVRNARSEPVNLTGWTIKDESASHRYSFPPSFLLGPAQSVAIHSGCGDDTAADLYWCNQGSAIWNNDGDTAFLVDPNGNIHHTYPYVPATTTTAATTTTTTLLTTTTASSGNCHSSYPDVCIPPPPPDLDCGDISFRRFKVTGSDPHGFDGDDDGIGCES